MMGTSIPISFALLEYGFILALEKFFGYTKDTKIYDTLAIILVLGFSKAFSIIDRRRGYTNRPLKWVYKIHVLSTK